MIADDAPWDNNHHHSSLKDFFTNNLNELYQPNIIELSMNFLSIYNVIYEKKLSKIEETLPLDISIKPNIFKKLHIGVYFSPNEVKTYKALFQEFKDVFSYSYKEIPVINPSIIMHNIKTYPDAKPVQ